MKTYKMDRLIRKYCKRFVSRRFPEDADQINRRAERIYQEFCNDAPDIGQGKNRMAGNFYQFLTVLAYYEASDRRITKADMEEVAGEILNDFRFVGNLINMNNPNICKFFYKVVRPYADKVRRMKEKGLWGNTWDVLINPENHDTGFSIHLVGCPLYDFAKTHGYGELLPTMCQIDHATAAMMHAKLIRKHTIASGADSCDYWYVGDRSGSK